MYASQGAGYAAIHWSALNANAKMTRLLLSMGADVNLKHKSVRSQQRLSCCALWRCCVNIGSHALVVDTG
jgi:ankyrin repeat protein